MPVPVETGDQFLVLPGPEFEDSYGSYIAELGDEERYPFPLDFAHHNFSALLRRLEDLANGTNLPEGFVPSSTFWLMDGAEIVGVSNLRHSLNETLRNYGGHIGLGIRPSRRGRGLGRMLLALTIQEARKRGMDDLHIHCYKDNEPSARMIISNGGVLDSEIKEEEHGKIVQRYVVAPPLKTATADVMETELKRKHISSGSEFESKFGYSRAVVDGDYVFVSGTTGYDYTTMSISDDVIEQAEQCFRNIEQALNEAGSSIDNIVRIRYIYPSRQDFEPCAPVFQKYLVNARPAATMLVAGLLDETMKIEIEVTARLNE